MRKITEQSAIGQLVSILGMLAMLVSLFGSVVLLAADSAINEKYASDKDLRAVQETFAAQVKDLAESVNANTRVSQATAHSVQNLALTIVTIQIRDLEPTIRELEMEKSSQGSGWSNAEERSLQDMRRSLQDLKIQRQKLFQHIGD